jgi:RNA polymerase-binding protein
MPPASRLMAGLLPPQREPFRGVQGRLADRAVAGPVGEPYGRGFAVAKIVVLYHCANKHQTLVPFIWTVTPPPQWECRICSQPAGTDPLNPPPRVARYMGEKTHLGRVRDRRTRAEGDRLMAESLARREHPEEFNVWVGPAGGRPDPGRRTWCRDRQRLPHSSEADAAVGRRLIRRSGR